MNTAFESSKLDFAQRFFPAGRRWILGMVIVISVIASAHVDASYYNCYGTFVRVDYVPTFKLDAASQATGSELEIKFQPPVFTSGVEKSRESLVQAPRLSLDLQQYQIALGNVIKRVAVYDAGDADSYNQLVVLYLDNDHYDSASLLQSVRSAEALEHAFVLPSTHLMSLLSERKQLTNELRRDRNCTLLVGAASGVVAYCTENFAGIQMFLTANAAMLGVVSGFLQMLIEDFRDFPFSCSQQSLTPSRTDIRCFDRVWEDFQWSPAASRSSPVILIAPLAMSDWTDQVLREVYGLEQQADFYDY